MQTYYPQLSCIKGADLLIIEGKNINDITFKVLEKLINEGYRVPSRNGDTLSLYDISLIIQNPRSRHLSLIGRTNNIFATFAETFWVLAGENKIKPYLEFFLPRAHKYSDDGITWRGAYGERLYAYNQLDNIVNIFKEDGIFTRRAVISLYMPNLDTKTSLEKHYNLTSTLDIPCNNWINFFVTPDKKLNMKVVQRSGDILFGVSHINIFEFSMLHEMLLQILQFSVDEGLKLGYHNQSITNLHLYETKAEQGYNILSNKLKQKFNLINTDQIFFPTSIKKSKSLFSSLIEELSRYIIKDGFSYKDATGKLESIFESYEIPTNKNLLWAYTTSILSFIYQKRFNAKLDQLNDDFCLEFNESITNNCFNHSKNKDQ